MFGIDDAIIGAGVSGAFNLAGGMLGKSGGVDLGAQQQFSMQQLQMQEQFQREMAQHGIQYRVDDAKRAGISPLAALGAPTISSVVSAPGIDYGASGSDNSSIGNALSRAGANLGDAIGKTMTAEDKRNVLMRHMQEEQQLKSNDLDLQIKAAQLARLNKILQAPSAPSIGGGDGMVKIVPDKQVAGKVGDPGVTAGTHPDSSQQRGASGATYLSPTDPAVINNPSITNPFMLRWMWDQYDRWFDRNVTNPLRSVFGMPPYQRQ